MSITNNRRTFQQSPDRSLAATNAANSDASVKVNIKRVEEQLTSAQQVLREYKKEIECLK